MSVNYYDDDEEDGTAFEGTDLGQATPKAEKPLALLVMLKDLTDKWIPKSVIHDDSECFSMKSGAGKLVVARWWAEKEGLT
jgi:hypothetical protein